MKFNVEKIKNCAIVFNGKTPSKEEQRQFGKPILKIKDIDEYGMFLNELPSCVDDKFYRKHSKKALKEGDTLVLNAAHSSQYVGSKTHFVEKSLEGVIPTGEWLVIRPNKNQINSKFLNIYINSPKGKHEIRRIVKGIHLYPRDVAKIKINIPPLEAQIRISTLLSRAEALITKRKESIRLLDELFKSTFWEMFGPEAKDFEEWPLIEMKELSAKKKGSMRTGPFGSNLLHSEFATEGDVAVLGIDNAVNNRFKWKEKRFISKEKYEQLKNYRIYPRDVIITIMGTTGRSAVIPDDIPLTINTKHLAAITLDKTKANPHFISYSIHSSPFIKCQLKSQTRGAIMGGLNLGIIKKLKINRPPIELQNQFAHIIKKAESLKTKYEASLYELENLYSSLTQRAFCGELDLSKVPIVHEVHLHDATSPTVVIEKTTKFELSFKVVKELISKKLPKQFTFEALWGKVNELLLDNENHEDEETLEGKGLQHYEAVQKIVYKMLNGSKPFLKQTFNKESKEIVLELAR